MIYWELVKPYFLRLYVLYETISNVQILLLPGPHKVKVLLTKKRINLTIVVIILFYLIWDGEEIIRRDLIDVLDERNNKTSKLCANVHTFLTHKQLFTKDIVNEVLASALPICILVSANIAIVVKVGLISFIRSTSLSFNGLSFILLIFFHAF